MFLFNFWVVWPPLHVSHCSSLTANTGLQRVDGGRTGGLRDPDVLGQRVVLREEGPAEMCYVKGPLGGGGGGGG